MVFYICVISSVFVLMASNDLNIYKTGRRVVNKPSAANKVENTRLSNDVHEFNLKYYWSNMFCDHFSWYDRKEKLIKFSFLCTAVCHRYIEGIVVSVV